MNLCSFSLMNNDDVQGRRGPVFKEAKLHPPEKIYMVPHFVVIGGMKCGSTALWHYLRMHPDIYLPDRIKNIEFFDSRDNWEKGVDWYSSFFPEDQCRGKVIGEVSTEYAKYPDAVDVPANMSGVIPEAKLVYLVRNPIARLKSHYIHMVGAAQESRGINQALEETDHNSYINYSRYSFQLAPFLRHYKTDSILVVCSEELKNDRERALNRIFRFIGVDDALTVNEDIRLNTSAERRRWNVLGAYIRKSDSLFNRYKYYCKRYPSVGKMMGAFLSRPIKEPVINDANMKKLRAIFSEDVNAFDQLQRISLQYWDL